MTVPSVAPAPSIASEVEARTKPAGTAKTTADAFEAVFIGQMTQMMMNTVDSDGTFGGGHGEEMFRGVMAEKLGTAITQAGGIGLSRHVMAEIIRLQGGGGDVA